jgi:hypothetical protein
MAKEPVHTYPGRKCEERAKTVTIFRQPTQNATKETKPKKTAAQRDPQDVNLAKKGQERTTH